MQYTISSPSKITEYFHSRKSKKKEKKEAGLKGLVPALGKF